MRAVLFELMGFTWKGYASSRSRLGSWLAGCLCACSLPPEREPHLVAPVPTREVAEGFGSARGERACPMAVEGTDVQLVAVRGGSALIFTSALASPEEVRRRAFRFAGRYTAGAGARLGSGEARSSPAGFPTRATYAAVAAGARVEIRPLTPERRPELRAHLRERLVHMRRTGEC